MKDKVVIVTGASSGIGLATAREFAIQGAKVVFSARSFDIIKQEEEKLRNMGCDVFAIKTDVSVEEDCKNLIEKTIEKYGKLDVLINNAGISMRAFFKEVDLNVLKQLMDVNFWGTVYCTKYALPYLLESKGSVVGVSSVAGFIGLPGRTGYSASKFAMHGFLETLRTEHLNDGLHVLILCAGYTKSNIRYKALLADGSPQGTTPREEEKMMMPEEVAKIIVKCVKKRVDFKVLSIEGKLSYYLKIFFPRLIQKSALKNIEKEGEMPKK